MTLKQRFPDATRREKIKPVDHGPDNLWFKESMKWFFWWFFCVPGLFAIGAITILILMGALKALGVKEL